MASQRGRGASNVCISLAVKTGTVCLVAVWIVAVLTGFSPGFSHSIFLPSIPTTTLSATDFDSPIPGKKPGEIDIILPDLLPNTRRSSTIRYKGVENTLAGTNGVVSGQGGVDSGSNIPNERFSVQLPVGRPRPPGWNKDPLDYSKPRTFFDISIDGKAVGRIVFELYTKQSPSWAENFRALCTGEKGFVPNEEGREGAGQPYHFKGKPFYRVIDQFICQTGVGTDSVYGGQFKDDVGGLLLKHNKRGLLSAANMGPDTNTSHLSILVAPAPHLDGHYTIFGEVVEGYDVVQKINAMAKPNGQPDEWPRYPVIIEDSGQLDCKEDGTCKVMQF